MDRAGTAEGEQRDAAQIGALLDGVHPGGGCHVLVDQLVDARCGVGDAQVERSANRCERVGAARRVERHVATEEEGGVEQAELEIGVGDGRLRPAEPVAGWTGVGAR